MGGLSNSGKLNVVNSRVGVDEPDAVESLFSDEILLITPPQFTRQQSILVSLILNSRKGGLYYIHTGRV